MIKKGKKIRALFIMSAFCMSLVACVKDENQDMSDTTAATIVQELKSEQEYRTALGNLGTDKADMELALEYYDALWQMDAFVEEDFDGLSQVYNQLGDIENMRNTLIRKHVYYPSEENIKKINEVVLLKNDSEQEIALLLTDTVGFLEDKTSDNVKSQISSEEWQQLMQDELVGVARKTKYVDEKYELQIVSDKNSTTIFLLNDSRVVYYKINSAGVIWGTANYENSSYNGEFDICYYGVDGSLVKECRGTFENAVSVGDFEIDYDGTTYIGVLDSEGKVTSKQVEDVTKNGGVVYAYNQTGDKYLYQENTDKESFVIDNVYLGFPIYEAW